MAVQLTDWMAYNTVSADFLKDFDASAASSNDWTTHEAIIKDMANYAARADLNEDGKIDEKDMVNNQYVVDAAR